MSQEALSMGIDLLRAIIGKRYAAQRHLAELIMLDAEANGAKGQPNEVMRGVTVTGGSHKPTDASSTLAPATKINQPHENGGRSEPVRITDADRRESPSEQRNDVKSGPSSTHGLRLPANSTAALNTRGQTGNAGLSVIAGEERYANPEH